MFTHHTHTYFTLVRPFARVRAVVQDQVLLLAECRSADLAADGAFAAVNHLVQLHALLRQERRATLHALERRLSHTAAFRVATQTDRFVGFQRTVVTVRHSTQAADKRPTSVVKHDVHIQQILQTTGEHKHN